MCGAKNLPIGALLLGIALLCAGATLPVAAQEDGCVVSTAARQPREALERALHGRGWRAHRVVEVGGCYEVDAVDEAGTSLEATFDAATLRLVEFDLDADCTAPMAEWRPREALETALEERGWRVLRVTIDDGCYEAEADDETGGPVEADFDPVSFRMLELEAEDR